MNNPTTDELIEEYFRLEGIILRDENVLQITLFEFEYIKGQLQGRLDILEELKKPCSDGECYIDDFCGLHGAIEDCEKEISKIKQALGEKL